MTDGSRFVISPEDFAVGVRQVRDEAVRAGRAPGAVELTGWPGSFDQSREDDLDLVAPYVAAGARRLLLRAQVAPGDDVADKLGTQIDHYRRKVLDRL